MVPISGCIPVCVNVMVFELSSWPSSIGSSMMVDSRGIACVERTGILSSPVVSRRQQLIDLYYESASMSTNIINLQHLSA